MLGLGVFVWLQALGGVVFGQFDRILLGVSLGALAVAPYALCVQFAQPIFGLTASGLNFLFPYLSGRASTISSAALKRTLLKAFACNLLMVACGAGMLLLLGTGSFGSGPGRRLRTVRKDPSPIVLGSALMGLGVTGTYAMQALGLFRTVACISLGRQSGDVAADDLSAAPHGSSGTGDISRLLRCGRVIGVSAAVSATEHREKREEAAFHLWRFLTKFRRGRNYEDSDCCRFICLEYLRGPAPCVQCGALPVAASQIFRPVHLVVAPWQRHFLEAAGFRSDLRLVAHIAKMDKSSLSRNLWYYRELPELANRLGADLVHLTYPMPVNGAAFACPTVVTLHDMYPYEIPMNFGFPKFIFNRMILNQCLRKVDAIACVSDVTLLSIETVHSAICMAKGHTNL